MMPTFQCFNEGSDRGVNGSDIIWFYSDLFPKNNESRYYWIRIWIWYNFKYDIEYKWSVFEFFNWIFEFKTVKCRDSETPILRSIFMTPSLLVSSSVISCSS